VNKIVPKCYSEYSLFTQDKETYDIKWQNLNLSINSTSSLLYNTNVKDAFKYTQSNDLNSYPYTAIVNTYYGGGYVFKMMKENNSIETILKQIQDLEKLTWINEQTSAIFLEFTLFNPNVNLFQHCLFVFEITSGGNFVSSSQLTPLNLFDINDTSLISFKIIMYLVYLGFVCILMAIEARELMKSKWIDYFRNAYNYFDLAIVAFSWASFSMYLYRLYSAYEIYNKLKRTDDKSLLFINFQYIASCQILFDFLMGTCVFFASLRFIKTLRFNKRVIVYVHAFKQSFNELISFVVILIIIWMGFVQAFYVLMNAENKEFASIYKSMESCFQIILGKFNSDAFVDSKSFLSEPMFVTYNVIILFIMVNLMVSILVNGFDLARNDNDLSQGDVDIFSYIVAEISSLYPFKSKSETNEIRKNEKKPILADYIQTFEKSVSKFLIMFKKVSRVQHFFKTDYTEYSVETNIRFSRIFVSPEYLLKPNIRANIRVKTNLRSNRIIVLVKFKE